MNLSNIGIQIKNRLTRKKENNNMLLTQEQKIEKVIEALESERYTLGGDFQTMMNRADLLEAFKEKPIDFTNVAFYCVCPDEGLCPNFHCDERCDKDYTLQLKCWEEALRSDFEIVKNEEL